MKYNTFSKGQTLLESVIALSLLIIILTAISVAVLTSLNNSSYVKQQNQANKLAQQGMEYLRDQLVNNVQFNYYSSSTGSKCLDSQNTLKATACDPLIATDLIYGSFKREASFSAGNCGTSGTITNGLQVTVTVSWTSGKCSSSYCNTQVVKSCFLDPAKAFPTAIPTIYQGV